MMDHTGLRSGFVLAGALVCFGMAACGWDTFDSRLGTGGSGGSGGSGSGGSGAAGGAGGGAAGGGGTGGGGSSACGRIDLMQDTFGGAVTGHIWYRSGDGIVNQDTGNLVTANPGTTDDFALYRSTRRYDLTGGTVDINILQVPDGSVSGAESAVFRIEQNNTRWASFRLNTNGIEAGIQQNDGYAVLSEPTLYDPDAHAYVRFSEQDGVLTWQVSSDGVMFTDLVSAPVSAVFTDVTRVRVALGAARGVNGVVSTSQLDTVTGKPLVEGAWCGVGTLRDDFSDTFRSSEWLNSTGTATASALQVDGQLVMTLAPGSTGNRNYTSSQAFDLTDDAFFVEIPELSAAPNTAFVELRGDQSVIAIRIVSTVDVDTMEELVEITATVDSAEDAEMELAREDYNPATHRWLRIRDEGGTLLFEYSSDATDGSWEQLASRSPNTIPIDDLLVAIGVSTSIAADPPGQTRFDNVNLAP